MPGGTSEVAAPVGKSGSYGFQSLTGFLRNSAHGFVVVRIFPIVGAGDEQGAPVVARTAETGRSGGVAYPHVFAQQLCQKIRILDGIPANEISVGRFG